MNEEKKVCVVMPVYNGEKTITRALKSLLNQTYKNWICIIINDGSTDNTKNILNSLSDLRFNVINREINVGRGHARQICLDNAEGDYLAYLDADDFYHSDKLRAQVEIMNNNGDIDLVGCEVLVYSDDFHPYGKRTKVNTKLTNFKFGDILPISMPTSMVKLDKATSIRYNTDLNASEDVDFFSKYLDGGNYLHVSNLHYYYYVSTKNTPCKKILAYTFAEFKRGLSMLGKANYAACRILLKSSFKWVTYAITIPIFGENLYLKSRNTLISKDEICTYEDQLDCINKVVL